MAIGFVHAEIEHEVYRLTVSLSEDQFAKIEAIAERNDTSVSWVVRLAVKKLLDEQGDQRELPMMSGV